MVGLMVASELVSYKDFMCCNVTITKRKCHCLKKRKPFLSYLIDYILKGTKLMETVETLNQEMDSANQTLDSVSETVESIDLQLDTLRHVIEGLRTGAPLTQLQLDSIVGTFRNFNSKFQAFKQGLENVKVEAEQADDEPTPQDPPPQDPPPVE